MNSLTKLGIFTVGACLICTTACRSSKWQSPNDVAALQAQRRDKVVKSVGLKQSEAEMQLARDAWTFGDRNACLSALDGILQREPGHVEALLLKAEVHLAKDELIDADRSIAIALSHDPSNSTAKRLSEITRTRQLAERPQTPPGLNVQAIPAPLPAGAVSQAAYSPSEAGTALVADRHPEFTEASSAILNSSIGTTLPNPEPAFAAAEMAHARNAFPEFVHSLPMEFGAMQPWEPQTLLASTEPLAIEQRPEPLALQDRQEPPAPESIAETFEPMPAALRPEEAAAYELSDAPAGTAEISDQTCSEDSQRGQNAFLSAIASADSVAALAAAEADLTNNPNDPQIPISATVAALEANQPETAASIARLGIAFHPTCAGLYRSLGAALYRTGNYPSSQVALRQALSLDNSSALAYFLLGCVSEKLGDTEAAESHFARATELDPNLAESE